MAVMFRARVINNTHARVPALPLTDARESVAPGAFIERVPSVDANGGHCFVTNPVTK